MPEKTFRIDEILNGLILRKKTWTEKDIGKYFCIMVEEDGELIKYIIDKKDGYLSSIQRQKNVR